MALSAAWEGGAEEQTLDHVVPNVQSGVHPGGAIGAISPPKTYESISLLTHDFVQFGKQHSRYKAILPSIVLSQQCCEVYFISLTVVNP